MTHDTLVSVETLAARLATPSPAGPPDWLVCDCSFDLADPGAGRRLFAQGHLPGAVYLHLDEDLSGAKTGHNGRHPLPEPDRLAQRMAALGAGDHTQIVVYDSSGGMFAARAWWLLRWLGHRAAAVLDGGSTAWRAADRPWTAESTPPPRTPGRFSRRAPLVQTIDHTTLRQRLGAGPLVDARAPDRFRGENETLDPVGGHIPGAVNRFFKDNLGPDGRFQDAAALRQAWLPLLAGASAGEVVHQCGSGVTACHNLLSMEVAGLGGSVLYPGSWSEWCAQPGAPVATGP